VRREEPLGGALAAVAQEALQAAELGRKRAEARAGEEAARAEDMAGWCARSKQQRGHNKDALVHAKAALAEAGQQREEAKAERQRNERE